jgi:hypothetical protein
VASVRGLTPGNRQETQQFQYLPDGTVMGINMVLFPAESGDSSVPVPLVLKDDDHRFKDIRNRMWSAGLPHPSWCLLIQHMRNVIIGFHETTRCKIVVEFADFRGGAIKSRALRPIVFGTIPDAPSRRLSGTSLWC